METNTLVYINHNVVSWCVCHCQFRPGTNLRGTITKPHFLGNVVAVEVTDKTKHTSLPSHSVVNCYVSNVIYFHLKYYPCVATNETPL